jgi:hypothetical protein
VLTPIRFEQISNSVREYHDVLVSPLQRDALQQAGRLKMIEAPPRRPLAQLPSQHLLDVTGRDNAEGPDGGQRLALPVVQLVGLLSLAHDLTLGPARQVYMPREHAAFVVSAARTVTTTA